MNRCKDCAHFAPPITPRSWEIRYDEEHPERRPRAGWGHCKLTDNDFDAESEARDTLAIAVDGSSYGAVLLVDPEFGCVQFSAKPDLRDTQ